MGVDGGMNAQPREAASPLGERGGGLYADPPVLPAGGLVIGLTLVLLFRPFLPHAPSRDGAAATRSQATQAAPEAAYVGPPAGASPVAVLLDATGDVEVLDAEGTSRGDARAHLALRAGDSVRTLTRSRARLSVGTTAYLDVGERSLIVFPTRAADRPAATPAPRLATLHGGTLSCTLGGPGGDGIPFELEVPGARLSVAGGARDSAVSFLVGRNPDSTTSISLLSGRMHLTRGLRTELLTEGYGVTLDAHGNVLERRTLPLAPDTLDPQGGSVVAYREVPPRIAFTWNTVGTLSRYRLRIARDAAFRDLLTDERVGGTPWPRVGLLDGEYYWSVSSLDGRHEGRPSVPRRLRILRDSDAPALTVDAIAEPSGPVVVRGRTEPDARVYVQGESVAPGPDGAFEARIARGPGAFLLLVEAVDAVGNVSTDSRIVTARAAVRAAVADTNTGL